MGVCGSGLCVIMSCGSGRREKLLEIAFQESKPGGVWGNMCACVITAGELQSWYHRPLGRRSDNGLHSMAKVATAPGARLWPSLSW